MQLVNVSALLAQSLCRVALICLCLSILFEGSRGSWVLYVVLVLPMQVMFSTMTAKYGVAFAHSLPSHLLSRVMGAVIMGMAPVRTLTYN